MEVLLFCGYVADCIFYQNNLENNICNSIKIDCCLLFSRFFQFCQCKHISMSLLQHWDSYHNYTLSPKRGI